MWNNGVLRSTVLLLLEAKVEVGIKALVRRQRFPSVQQTAIQSSNNDRNEAFNNHGAPCSAFPIVQNVGTLLVVD
jgi:hypothetical protein